MDADSGHEQGASEVIGEAQMLRAAERGIAEAVEGTATDSGMAALAAHGLVPAEGASQAELEDRVKTTEERHQGATQALKDKEGKAQEHFEDNQQVYIEAARREAEEAGHTISENPDVATEVKPKTEGSEIPLTPYSALPGKGQPRARDQIRRDIIKS